jgi:hypothetical protein
MNVFCRRVFFYFRDEGKTKFFSALFESKQKNIYLKTPFTDMIRIVFSGINLFSTPYILQEIWNTA